MQRDGFTLKNGRAKLLLSRTCYTARLGGSLALPETGFSTGGYLENYNPHEPKKPGFFGKAGLVNT